MGLRKHITLPNGVQLNYHRVTSVNNITNVQTVIEVSGYTSQAKRREEATMISDPENNPADVFIDTRFIAVDYDPEMTISKAYDYLKTLPEFEGAEDALEE